MRATLPPASAATSRCPTTSPAGDVTVARTVAAALCRASTSMSTTTSRCPVSPAVGASVDSRALGRTVPIRTPAQRSSVTGRHSPDVVSCGPQSHPKLQAILRTKLYGLPRGLGRSPVRSRCASACVTGASNEITNSLPERSSSPDTSKRYVRCWFSVRPSGAPLSVTVANPSMPSNTSAVRRSSGSASNARR